MKEKTNRRRRIRYPGLVKDVNLKIRHEVMDEDYIDKLSEAEKEWLSRFNEEYNSANFNHKGKMLHRTKKLKKNCYDRNNSRNRDGFSQSKSKNMLMYDFILPASQQNIVPDNVEDFIIETLDLKKRKKLKY